MENKTLQAFENIILQEYSASSEPDEYISMFTMTEISKAVYAIHKAECIKFAEWIKKACGINLVLLIQ